MKFTAGRVHLPVLLALSRGYSGLISPPGEFTALTLHDSGQFHQPFPPSSAHCGSHGVCEREMVLSPLPNTNPSRSWKKIMAPKGIKEAGAHIRQPHAMLLGRKHMYVSMFMYPGKLSFYF